MLEDDEWEVSHWLSGLGTETPSFGPELFDELLAASPESQAQVEMEVLDVRASAPSAPASAPASAPSTPRAASTRAASPLPSPRRFRVPKCSVLESSGLRKRMCLPPRPVVKRPEPKKPKKPKPGPRSPTPEPPKELPPLQPKEVKTDYRQPTKSWLARIPSDESLEERRQDRHRIVVAERITPLATARAHLTGKSLLEERWIGNLDDSQADTEMSLPAVLAWFRRTNIYKHTLLTDAEVVDYVQQMLAGRRVAAIVSVANRRSNTISAVQFQALVHWIAQHKGITFSECISKLVRHPAAERTRLEHYFTEFGHGSSNGFMTVYEFTKFCKAFGLFKSQGRFVEGDVQNLFSRSQEGKAVDLEGFRRVLGEVAKRLEMPLQDLLHLLGEKEAERSSLPIGK